jgi:hypothetical protein
MNLRYECIKNKNLFSRPASFYYELILWQIFMFVTQLCLLFLLFHLFANGVNYLFL